MRLPILEPEALEGRDLPEMLRQRDELLIQLIAAKTTQSQIP
jgi:hypothetical protein